MPRTETGKAEAARHYFVHFGNTDSGCICGLAWPCPRVEAIDAIEAEAAHGERAGWGDWIKEQHQIIVAAERARIKAAVEGLPLAWDSEETLEDGRVIVRRLINRAAVLRIIDGEDKR